MKRTVSRSAAMGLMMIGLFTAPLLTACYTLQQGTAYLSLLSKAKPVARLMADPALPESRRALLEKAARIRAFAIDELGLTDTENYTSLIEIDGDRVATVVQACAELSFDRYLWKYPVVGKLPYMGFFNPADAEKERKRLKASGLDVIVRGVESFSTLGWFKDPLFSFMERYRDAELAELLIHEMTHATAFSKQPGSFNEELATFVGRLGAEAWIEKQEGADAPALTELRAKRKDAELFASFLSETAKELTAVYKSGMTDAEKRAGKSLIIAERAERYKMTAATVFTANGYRKFPMEKVNNAFIDLYALYEGEPRLYADYFHSVCSGDLKRFIADAAIAAKTSGDPKEALRSALSKNAYR